MPKIDCLFLHVPYIFFHDREEYKSTVNYIAMGIFLWLMSCKKINSKQRLYIWV